MKCLCTCNRRASGVAIGKPRKFNVLGISVAAGARQSLHSCGKFCRLIGAQGSPPPRETATVAERANGAYNNGLVEATAALC